MSIIETFDNYVSNLDVKQEPELKKFIKKSREYLLELNTEDERYRYFEEFIKEFYLLVKSKSKK